MKESRVESRKSRVLSCKILLFCILIIAYCLLLSCSQPILESPECIASRDVVKRFYSTHFGNDMKPTTENLEKKKDFLSKELFDELKNRQNSKSDYWTQTENYPKAFRVGKCESSTKEKTVLEVLLFWRENDKNIQREINVETVKENDKWLINRVLSKN